jgi:hypothetical protein
MEQHNVATRLREPWNKGKLVGQKSPFKLKEIWAIRGLGEIVGLFQQTITATNHRS